MGGDLDFSPVSLPEGATWLDLAKAVADQYGKSPSEADIDWLLWEHTSFPLADPEHVELQLHQFFQED